MAKRHSTKPGDVQPERNSLPSLSGNGSDQRMKAAAQRAIDAHRDVARKASLLTVELDDMTPVHGIPTTNLSEEDSAVHAVVVAIEAAKIPT